MADNISLVFEIAAAAVSVLLMGLCAARLLVRFAHVLKGTEPACGFRRTLMPP